MGPYHPELKIPVNPWDATRWSGVSSSGSGVATAAGLCFASIGTDTGGSIRYPAAANGCVGLKPTYGRVSRHGVFPLAESMDHVGPMARTVEDAAIMFDAIAGFDPNDPTSLAEPASPVRSELSSGVAGFRIGFDRRYATEGLDPDLGRAMDAVLESLASAGADIVDITMPDVGGVGPAWWDLSTAEAAAFHAETYPSRSEDYGSGFRAVLDHGLGVSGVDYANAARFRAEFAGRMNRLLGTVDCMVCPSFGGAAPRIGAQGGVRDSFTKPFNFSGSPTLSMPCGFSPDGLPYSVQFVGRPLSEAVLCRVGYTFERATEWHLRHPPI
jgi:amidase